MRSVAYALCLLLLSASALADRIVLVGDPWCPFNCGVNSKYKGYLVDIAKRALERHGHTVVYQTLPWNRAVLGVRLGQFTGLLGAGRAEAIDFVLPDEPQAVAEHAFFTRPDSQWQFSGMKSLERIHLGAVDGYSYGTIAVRFFNPALTDSTHLSLINGHHLIPRLIEMLYRHRIDAFIAERAVLNYTLKTMGNAGNTIRNSGTASIEPLYIAFSPANGRSADYARQLSEGLQAMRMTGELTVLQRRYGLLATDAMLKPKGHELP